MVSNNKAFIVNHRQKGPSILRVLFAISSLASASAVCPQGYFELNGICTQQTSSCPHQYVLMNGACYFATAGSCPSTSLQINGQCCSQSCINSCQTQNNCNCCVSNTVNSPAPIIPSVPSAPCPNTTPCQTATCPNTTPCQTAPCPSQPVCPNQPLSPCPTQPVTPCSTQPCPTQPATPCPTQPSTPCPTQPCPNQPTTPCPAQPLTPCPIQQPTPCPQTNTPCPVQPTTPCPTQPTTPCPNSPPSTPCPVQPQPCPLPPITYPPPIYPPVPTYPPPVYTPPPTTPTTTTTTTTSTTPKPYYPTYTPPPDPITKCPDGTVLVNGICRLVYCGRGIYKDNRCIQTTCPDGTVWTGYKCAYPEPIVNSVLFNNTVITHFNHSQPDVVVNNVNNVVVNATTAIDMNMHNEAQPLPSAPQEEDCDETPAPPTPAPRPSSKCCTVITPRMCRPSPQEGRWSCYSKRARRCGSFCVAPTIYLKTPRVYQDQTRMVLPPDPDFGYCRRTHSCPESLNAYDCSGCGMGQLDRCSSYCYNYNCNLRKCQFYDQREYCSEYGGGYGCQQQDGCYDDWCSG